VDEALVDFLEGGKAPPWLVDEALVGFMEGGKANTGLVIDFLSPREALLPGF